jgi:hypothetical protein
MAISERFRFRAPIVLFWRVGFDGAARICRAAITSKRLALGMDPSTPYRSYET